MNWPAFAAAAVVLFAVALWWFTRPLKRCHFTCESGWHSPLCRRMASHRPGCICPEHRRRERVRQAIAQSNAWTTGGGRHGA